MLVLGIDPGTAVTGFGLLESDGTRHHCLGFGAVKPSARGTVPERLLTLYEKVAVLLEKAPFDALAIEDLFYAVNVQSALRLSQARGVIMLCAAQRHIPVFEYSPLEIKNAVVGYGRAEKSQVQEMVRLLLKLDEIPEPTDAADALAVAICHAQTHSSRERIRKASSR